MLDCVLFDLGGVLTPDPWQSIVLTPGRGLVDSLGLDRARADKAGDALWPKYSRGRYSEAQYWAEFSGLLGTTLPAADIDRASADLIVGNPGFAQVRAALGDAGIRWGVISDNTPFWYERQLRCLRVDGRVDAELEFLSFRHGVAKTGTRPTLFEVAAKTLDPARTLVVDDRDKNVAAAAATGFASIRYGLRDDRDGAALVAVVRQHVEQ